MKNLKTGFSLTGVALVFCLLLASNVYANDYGVTDQKLSEIEARVNKMSIEQLNARKNILLSEQASLSADVDEENTASSSGSSRLSEIAAELSAIQKALIAVAGLGAVSAFTDEGYNDQTPPVITIAGDNPATVELGTSYTDAGATANDAFHGDTPVTSSGSVDTSTVGSYTITYSATDKDGNTASATAIPITTGV